MKEDEKVVFVTVGTTCFDELIETVTKQEALEALHKKGFQKMVLQIGTGTTLPETKSKHNPSDLPTVEYFRLKPSLGEDIKTADLVISHAGAGSVLEALEAKKNLLVVVNENLMNNHQMELAQQFHSTGHLSFCNCRNLIQVLNSNLESVNQYTPGNPSKFTEFVDKVMGY